MEAGGLWLLPRSADPGGSGAGVFWSGIRGTDAQMELVRTRLKRRLMNLPVGGRTSAMERVALVSGARNARNLLENEFEFMFVLF